MPVCFITEIPEEKYLVKVVVKIGFSKNVERRIKALQTGNTRKLRLMGWIESEDDVELERELHRKYRLDRKSIGEWFELEVEDILYELKHHSINSYIAVNDNAFEIVGYDSDAIPELYGAWDWAGLGTEEFCPFCGWGGGMDYNENYGGIRCLKCGNTEVDFNDSHGRD